MNIEDKKMASSVGKTVLALTGLMIVLIIAANMIA